MPVYLSRCCHASLLKYPTVVAAKVSLCPSPTDVAGVGCCPPTNAAQTIINRDATNRPSERRIFQVVNSCLV